MKQTDVKYSEGSGCRCHGKEYSVCLWYLNIQLEAWTDVQVVIFCVNQICQNYILKIDLLHNLYHEKLKIQDYVTFILTCR